MTLNPIERLGIPSIRMTDGPTGVRSPDGKPATVFPVGVAMAATWNRDLTAKVGAAIGKETLAHGADVLLAPTVNIVRTPRWGRNFETYSEDPYLAGQIGLGYVKGAQGAGIGVSLKHFAANNQETNRFIVDSVVDPHAARDLPPGVRDGDQRGRSLVGHGVVQQDQRYACGRESLAAHRPAQDRVGL
jgi:beta-glucosidase